MLLGILLFLPAWSLYYWHGWVYLLILLVWIIFAIQYFLKRDPKLLERRLRRGPTAEKEMSQKIIQLLASIFAFSIFVIAGMDFRSGWSEVPMFLVIAACLLVILSFRIIFLVFRENSYASSIIEIDSEQKVISSGPYSIVRHPMYSGSVLLYLVTPIALGSFAALPLALAVLVMIILRLLNEEKFLSGKLKDYKEYCSTVRYRLIPHVW